MKSEWKLISGNPTLASLQLLLNLFRLAFLFLSQFFFLHYSSFPRKPHSYLGLLGGSLLVCSLQECHLLMLLAFYPGKHCLAQTKAVLPKPAPIGFRTHLGACPFVVKWNLLYYSAFPMTHNPFC